MLSTPYARCILAGPTRNAHKLVCANFEKFLEILKIYVWKYISDFSIPGHFKNKIVVNSQNKNSTLRICSEILHQLDLGPITNIIFQTFTFHRPIVCFPPQFKIWFFLQNACNSWWLLPNRDMKQACEIASIQN